MSIRFRALVAYDGRGYCGWQRQAASVSGPLPSLQETIEEALGEITGAKVRITGSGRTDSGVHASGQVAHFDLPRKEKRPWTPEILLPALNSKLPEGVRMLRIAQCPASFHAQRSAVKKQYSYYFQEGAAAVPSLLPFSLWVRKPLDLEAMREGARALLGRRDFAPFQASGASVKTTVREILEATLETPALGPPFAGSPLPEGFRVVRFRVVGTGFLKQMVRSIAGTLLQIGQGRRPPSLIEEILRKSQRSLVGTTAPAHGLWLEHVHYDD